MRLRFLDLEARAPIQAAGGGQVGLGPKHEPLIAASARKGDGFTVTSMGANVTVNNQKVSSRQELRDGDIIQVSGLSLEFRLV